MTKLNVIKKFNRTRLMRVALVLLMVCFTNDMFGQQLYVAIQSFNMRTRTVNEFPEDEQTMGKYFSLDGQFITSYEYPLKNLPLRYQYDYTDGDRSYYLMVSTDIITGRAYYNKNNYVAVSTEGYIDTVTGDIGFTYLPIDESTLISRRQNTGSGSSYGRGGNVYVGERELARTATALVGIRYLILQINRLVAVVETEDAALVMEQATDKLKA